MTSENFHDVPQAMYDRLVAWFGESNGAQVNAPDTKWVNVGAGNVTLTFFAPPEAAESDDDAAESVVRDPEAWQAVAAEGRRFA